MDDGGGTDTRPLLSRRAGTGRPDAGSARPGRSRFANDPWLAMAGAVLFFISDGFVAWNMFHHDPDPTLAFWRSFAGWMIYWAGQAGLCFGALALRRAPTQA